jgi:hypothetical protein
MDGISHDRRCVLVVIWLRTAPSTLQLIPSTAHVGGTPNLGEMTP